MEGAVVGGAIALALTAGSIATKKDAASAAIKDRHKALRRAVGKKSAEIPLGDLDEAEKADERRAALAKDLEKHGATKDRDVIITARELLALIKVDDVARASVDEMIGDVEAALIKLSEVDVEGENITKHESTKTKTEPKPKPKPKPDAKAPSAKSATSSTRLLPGESQRILPADEPSKTELERSILPIHKRTERFFMKAGVVAGIIVVLTIALYIALRKPPNESMEACQKGNATKCWEVVAAQDAVDEGRNVSPEPLLLLCNQHQDACACADLAYLTAAEPGRAASCSGFESATAIDPKWPCTCRRYNLWRLAQQTTSHCGIPRCE